MAKYIIDIPNDRVCDYVGSTHLLMPYIMAGHKGHHDTGLNLTPYTEPDISDRKSIEDEVWKFVRFCFVTMDGSDFVDAFDSCSYVNLLEYSYQEAKARYETWLKQKDELCVGDEVEAESGSKACVLCNNPNGSQAFVFKDDGKVALWSKDAIHKTNKHFDEIEVLLKKLGEK